MGKPTNSPDQRSSSRSRGKKSKFAMYRGGRGGGGYRGGRGGGGYGGGGSRKKYLMEGMKGFLCTCNFNEKDCTKEALNLLNEYVKPEDFPEPKNPLPAKESQEQPVDSELPSGPVKEESKPLAKEINADDDDDIEGSLKAEIAQLKQENTQGKQSFFAVHPDSQNIVFIKTTVKDPTDLAHRILADIVANQSQKSRFLLRMLPIELTCKARMDQLEGIAHRVFPKYFKNGHPSYQILFKARCNNNIKREEVIKTLAEIVTQINPMSIVNLSEPKYTVIVEVIKSIICLGVVTDYLEFKKYNLIEASGQTTGQGSGDAGKGIKPALDPSTAVATGDSAPETNEETEKSEVGVTMEMEPETKDN